MSQHWSLVVHKWKWLCFLSLFFKAQFHKKQGKILSLWNFPLEMVLFYKGQLRLLFYGHFILSRIQDTYWGQWYLRAIHSLCFIQVLLDNTHCLVLKIIFLCRNLGYNSIEVFWNTFNNIYMYYTYICICMYTFFYFFVVPWSLFLWQSCLLNTFHIHQLNLRLCKWVQIFLQIILKLFESLNCLFLEATRPPFICIILLMPYGVFHKMILTHFSNMCVENLWWQLNSPTLWNNLCSNKKINKSM